MNGEQLDQWRAAAQDARSPLKSRARLCVALIADYSCEQGHPANIAVEIDQLIRHSAASRPSIYRTIQELKDQGFLAVASPAVDGRAGTYRPTVPAHLSDAVVDWPARHVGDLEP